MANVFDHLHIKRNTAGSSNELSFDVLDAASSEASEKPVRTIMPPKAPKSNKGSYSGVNGAAPVSQQAEVERRKQARKAHSVRTGIIVSIVIVAVAGGVIWFALNHSGKAHRFSDDFNALVTKMEKEDELMASVDALMSTAPSDDNESQRSETLSKIEDSKENLKIIDANVTTLHSESLTPEDEIALDQLAVSAKGRIEMLDTAKETLNLASNRGSLSKSAEESWNMVVKADQIARNASLRANKAETEEETKEARDETKKALSQMKKALKQFESLSSASPDLELENQIKYIELRIKSLGYAVETSEALIEGDREKAADKNEQYNSLDKEAAELANKLPLSAGKTIDEAFEKEMASCLKKYDDARQKVIVADSHVREYIASR